jgi:predicted DNA-binding protein
MILEFKPNQEAKIAALAAKTGRNKSEILEEVIDSYFDELADVRQMLDQRYDQFKTGRLKELTPEEVREDIERRKREFLQQPHEP